MALDITLKIKEEIERLVWAGVIRPARYVEWLSNIVPVLKKNGKLRICIDFRNINIATPKDEYPMPVANLLIDGHLGIKPYLLWMDIQGIIKYSLQKMTCIKLHLDVLDL
jgi:hypothetical protein